MPVENVLSGYGIPRGILRFSDTDTASNSGVSFEDGLRAAIAAFLNDEKGTGAGNSPLALIMADPEAHGLASDANAAACSDKLLEYLKSDSKAEIVLLTSSTMANEKYRFGPEEGENTYDNWVFRFMLPATFDILMWSIVNKEGAKPAYCYSVE